MCCTKDDPHAAFARYCEAKQLSAAEAEAMLQAQVNADIRVDTGDGGWDYTANTVPPAYDAEHSLKDAERDASIVWLTRQQGHRTGELYFSLAHIKEAPESISTPLMRGIAAEVKIRFAAAPHTAFVCLQSRHR